ncbi:CIA complex protein [Malassezia pachydermatis]|uniref:MMS19 nucleotide excision repair protein n=1 Tax=Malassezia pachydermatis TaxID=77020 RepID=A0A0M8MUI5_9BASI|nr:arm repeat-containing protein [Malassezia pachydermatis]KOS14604.1 arm repeat-containing protein [Malassezia pachydermatis]
MDKALEAYVANATYADVPPSIVEDVSTGAVPLVALVRAMGAYLTSEEDAYRARAVGLLSHVVQHLCASSPSHTHAQLTRNVMRTLTEFFSEKLTDAVAVGDALARRMNDATLVPASASHDVQKSEELRAMKAEQMLYDCLQALLALSSVGYEGDHATTRDAFGGEEARTVSRALFGLSLKLYPQPLRMVVCKILDSLVARQRQALRAMRTSAEAPDGSAFIQGYTKLVAGEKDPRNLLVLFGLARVLLLEWPMAPAEAEAMYNVLYCYFPISFRPLPDDPYGIAPDDLKRALRACLAASPALATHGIPILLEKLGASGGAAKLDTLQTWQACLPVYGAAAAAAHADDVWSYLKLDILQPTDDASSDEAQRTLTVLLRVLYTDAPVEGLAETMLREALQEMREPSKSLAKLSVKIAQSFVQACARTSTYATEHMLRQLLMQWSAAEAPEEAVATLSLLTSLLDILATTYADDASRTYAGDQQPLHAFHDELLAAYTSSTACACEAGLCGLVRLLECPALLPRDECTYAVQRLQSMLLDEDEMVRAVALQGLERVLAVHKQVVEQTTLPFLLTQLPHTLQGPPRHVQTALSALARLCTPPDLFDALVVRIFSLLSAIGRGPADAAHTGYACALLATLQVALERKIEQGHTDVARYAASIPPRLLTWLTREDHVAAAVPVVQQASDMLLLLVPHLPAAKAQTWLDTMWAEMAWPQGPTCPLGAADTRTRNLLAPYAAILVAVTREITLPASAWIAPLLTWLQVVDSDPASAALQTRSASFLLCALANKWATPDEEALQAYWQTLPTLPVPQRKVGLAAWLWLARGWAACGTTFGTAMFTRVLSDMLEDARLGSLAASALHVLAENDEVMTRAHGFRLRILYKQRLLDTLVDTLVDAYHTKRENEAARTTCLIAIATVLPALPDASLRGRLEALLPLLVHTLSIDDARARTSAAKALHLAVTQWPADRSVAEMDAATQALQAHVEDQASTLVRRLLANSTPGAATPPSTRIASLHVLSTLATQLPLDVLLPMKRDVIHALGQRDQGVDDPRRAVRSAAVDCRDVWYRLQQAETT